MSTMQSAQLEPALLELSDKVLVKHFEESRKLTKRIQEGERINTRGRRVPVYVRENPSFGWHPEAGGLATPGTTSDLETKVYPVRCSQGFEFSGTYFRQVGSPESLLKGITQFFARNQATAMKKWEQAFCCTQTGELGVVVSRDSGTQVTFSITYANGSLFSTRKIQPGAILAFYSSAGVQRTGGANNATVSITTEPVNSTGVATFSSTVPTDVVATDIAVFGDPSTAGSYNRAVTGLQDFVDTTGVIQGQSRTVNRRLQSIVDDAGGAAITAIRLRKNCDALQFRTEDMPASFTIVSSVIQKSMLRRQMLNQFRYPNPSSAPQQVDSLNPVFDDYEWETSVDVHDDRIYYLQFDAFKWHPLKPWGRYNEDGLDWRLYFSNGAASDKFTGWTGAEGNFSCNHFNIQVLIKNNAVPTDGALGYLSAN